LAVTTLGDEARDDPMEDDVVVETAAGELDEVGGRLRRALVVELDLDVSELWSWDSSRMRWA